MFSRIGHHVIRYYKFTELQQLRKPLKSCLSFSSLAVTLLDLESYNRPIIDLACIFADASNNETQTKKCENPSEADQDAHGNFKPINAPSSTENVSQRFDGIRLRHKETDVTQVDWHPLCGPKDTAHKEVDINTSQTELNGAS